MTKTLIVAAILAVALTACNKKEDTAAPASSAPSTSAPVTPGAAGTTPAPGGAMTGPSTAPGGTMSGPSTAPPAK